MAMLIVSAFEDIYGDGTSITKGIPLFVFNYMDYKLWDKYATELRGEKTQENSVERRQFFVNLGCTDLGLDIFDDFIFHEPEEVQSIIFREQMLTRQMVSQTMQRLTVLEILQ